MIKDVSNMDYCEVGHFIGQYHEKLCHDHVTQPYDDCQPV